MKKIFLVLALMCFTYCSKALADTEVYKVNFDFSSNKTFDLVFDSSSDVLLESLFKRLTATPKVTQESILVMHDQNTDVELLLVYSGGKAKVGVDMVNCAEKSLYKIAKWDIAGSGYDYLNQAKDADFKPASDQAEADWIDNMCSSSESEEVRELKLEELQRLKQLEEEKNKLIG